MKTTDNTAAKFQQTENRWNKKDSQTGTEESLSSTA